jgi:formamidopyrimidine-DNA glycosylase
MIELPEAVTLARQMSAELQGKCIARGVQGHSPHKFAFYAGDPAAYPQILEGKTLGAATAHGMFILLDLNPGYTLALGCGGERILLHDDEKTLPRKHQLLLEFTDGTYLSVSVQGWGAVQLAARERVATDTFAGLPRVSPLSDEFTLEYLQELFADRKSVV